MISSPSVTIFVTLLYARQMHCLHARMYSHMSAYMRTHTHVHKRAGYMHACVHTRTHALVHTCTQHAMFMCACIPCTHVWTRAHTRARFRQSTCTHEPIHAYAHARTSHVVVLCTRMSHTRTYTRVRTHCHAARLGQYEENCVSRCLIRQYMTRSALHSRHVDLLQLL